MTKPVVAIDIGHSERDKGAAAPFHPFTTEWDYNCQVAGIIQNQLQHVLPFVIFRDPVNNGYQRLPAKINLLDPHFIISLHCNAAISPAFGTEMIHHPCSGRGIQFAAILQREVSSVFGWEEGQPGYRGIKPPVNGRGSTLLSKTRAPCVIAEPFFLTNRGDHQKGLDRIYELGAAYAIAIDQFAEQIDWT